MVREFPVEFCGCFFICGISIFRVIKITKMNISIINSDCGSKFLVPFVPTNSLKARSVSFCFAGVIKVLRSRGEPKISYPVIGFISVYVINFSFRPSPRAHRPSHPVGHKVLTIKRYVDIPVSARASGDAVRRRLVSTQRPAEKAGFWLVIQKLFEEVNVRIFHPHIISDQSLFSMGTL